MRLSLVFTPPLVAAILLLVILTPASSQTPGTPSEIWPKLIATVELWPKTRFQVWGEKQNGEDFDFNQWKVGALLSYRMKGMVNVLQHDIDEEGKHHSWNQNQYAFGMQLPLQETSHARHLLSQAELHHL